MANINHGLTVYSGGHGDASQRLQRPVVYRGNSRTRARVTNCFNDAISAEPLQHIYGKYGHSGIDFGSGANAPVVAMYGGVVIGAIPNWTAGSGSLGKYVQIRSCTNPDSKSGFVHTYLHLNEVHVVQNQHVKKGQQIGLSGKTGDGIDDAHLHVHLAPFDGEAKIDRPGDEGYYSEELKPPNRNWAIGDLLQPPVRVKGRMNFLCFLEPDSAALAPVITAQSFTTNLRKVLSPRAWNAKIPLFIDPLDTYDSTQTYETNQPGQTHATYVGGNETACYIVLEERSSVENAPRPFTWYKIRHSDYYNPGSLVEGWVPSRGKVGGKDSVAWVHVEAAATPALPSRATLTTNNANTNVRSAPTLRASSRGVLDEDEHYTLHGSFLDSATRFPGVTDPVAVRARRLWWQIEYKGGPGWVRSDVVSECGITGRVPLRWLRPPRDLRVRTAGSSVQLSWSEPLDVPDVLAISGYRIRRYDSHGAVLLDQADAVLDIEDANTAQTTDTPGGAPGTLYYYQVAAVASGAEGTRTGPASAAVSAPAASSVPGDGGTPPAATTTVAVALDQTGPLKLRAGSREEVENFTLPAGAFRAARARLTPRGAPATGRWLRLDLSRTGTGSGASGASGASGQGSAATGWAPQSALRGGNDWPSSVDTLPQPPFVRARGSWRVPVRIGPSLGYTEFVSEITSRNGWYEVIGKSADWWQIRLDAAREGWVQNGQVEKTGDRSGVPVVNPVPPPPAPRPGGGNAPAAGAWQASGPFLNLSTSWEGAWGVTKTGTTVTASFQSSRSPVQYYARQNPEPLFVLPAGFRPTVRVSHEATGTHVHDNGTEYDGSPRADFDLTIGTNGELRYVNNSKVDHVGFLKYRVTELQWQTAEAVEVPGAPTAPDIEATGTYHNQQENRGSSWAMKRKGDEVKGTFTTTSSPVEYFANQNREALVWLPAEYWPAVDKRFEVTGAVQVDREGTAIANADTVNFWVTVRSRDGCLYYDRDAALTTAGVGYLSYSLKVKWDASPRITVPSVPRDLEVDDVEADEVELDWDPPADDGGDAVDEYKVEVYRNGRWREVEDDISRTGYDVEDLDPHTTYTFRVRARNRAGWSAPSTDVTVTTPRETPGRPGRPSATATHEQVALDWDAPSAGGTVTGYRVQRKTGSGSWETLVADTGSGVSFHVDRGVQPTTAYRYRVAAHNHGELGDWSSSRSVTTLAAPTIPGQPTGLTVVPGTESRLQLNWTAPADTGGGITGYRVERSPDETPRVWSVVQADTGSAAVSRGDDAVAADTVYHYRVSARNSAGVGTPSIEAEGRTRSRLRLDGLVPYPLKAHAEPRTESAVTTTLAFFLPERTYDLVGQVPGPDGWWRMLLFDITSSGPYWLPAAAGTALGDTSSLPQPPSAPQAFTAPLTNNQVTLGWQAPATGGTVTGYRVWRQEGDGGFAQLGADLAATVLAHTDVTVQTERVYRYRLQAQSVAGWGLPTATVAIAVMAMPEAPAAVTGVTAVSASAGTSLQLGWARAATGGLPAGYRVAWRRSGSTDDFETVTVTGTSHDLSNLMSGTSYEIQITAFNQEGDAPAASHTGTTLLVAPGVPEAVVVTVLGQDATATWADPTTGGRPDEYHLQVKAQATTVWPTTHTVVTDPTHNLSSLGYEVAHDLRVRASNTVGQSAWVAVAFTTEALPRVPGTPTGLTATPSADSQLRLVWAAPADAGSPAVSGYRIERSADTTPRVWTVVVEDTGSPRRIWDDAGLAAATVYRYRVSARNRTGVGSKSTEAAGTTRPQAALAATAAYPLMTRAWPAAAAPATHTWSAHDAALKLDVAGRVGGPDGWWRVVRFGAEAAGPYWLPAAAVTVTGAVTGVPEAPGVPGSFRSTAATHASATLTWSAPTTGGTVTGYRLWRRTGMEAWVALDAVLDAATLTHTDTGLTAATAYQYRLQALSAAGAGVPTAEVEATTAAELTPVVREYGPGTHTLDFPPGYTTFYVQLCGGAGGGAGGQGEASNGADGGDGGCTFYATHRGGHAWTLEVGEGGAGGRYHERWAYDGKHGEPSALRRDGILAATAARGERGESISHDGADGATVGSSGNWGAAWPGNHRVPRGGRGGAGFHEEAGSAGADGLARVLFTGTPSDRLPIMPTELVVAPGLEGRLRLTWEEGATVGPATGYRIERSADVEPPVWTEVAANTGTAERVWHDSDLAAATVYRYRVTGRNGAGLGTPSMAAAGRTRPQAALLATAAYPLTARAWPLATAPVTHTWDVHDAALKLDVAGKVGGTAGWWRVLRFGAEAAGPYWLPTASVRVTGAATGVSEVPGVPGDLAVTEVTDTTVTLTWTVPVTGGTVIGYQLWRQPVAGDWALAGETLAADALMHTDTGLTLSTGYRYRLHALSAGGPGIPATVGAITGSVPPLIRNYDAGTHTLTVPVGYDTLYAQLCGGGGGGGGAGEHNGEDGGRGGATYYTAGVTVGDLLTFVVGEGGDGGDGEDGSDDPEDGEDGEVSYLRINSREVAIGKHGRGGVANTSGYPNLDGPIRGSSAGWPASWPGDARRPAHGALGFTNYKGGHGSDGGDGLARMLLMPTAPPVVPGTPTDLAAAPSADSQMALSWTAPATGAVVAGYRIERSPDVEPRAWAVIAEDTGSTAESWDDAGLDGDTVYRYRVTARSVVTLGEPSAPAAGRTRPRAALLATAAYPLTARAWPLATAPATHTWTAHDATVKLDVTAQDAGGNWYRVLRFGERIRNAYWLPAAAVTVTGATADLLQAPGAPGDLAPPTATHDTVTLTWSAPTTGGAVTGYRVWRQTGEEAFTIPGADLAADVLAHTDTTVAGSTAYQYRVQAVSAAGAGMRTPAVAVTTAATPREPGVPTAVTAAPGADSPMVLTWTAPADAGTQPITGYRIERAAEAATLDWVAVAADTATTDLTWSDSGLTAATTYHYRVSARNAVGVGDPSDESSGTTRPRAALLATATYPLTAHQWPVATAPVSHTWSAYDASVQLEVAGQGAGGGWYRVLRFGQGTGGPYWLPAGSVTVTGATADLPQVPGIPGDLRTTDLQGRVVLTWSAPATGGTVTGYRLWRQTGEAAWAVLADSLDAATLTYTDMAVTATTTYGYRLQAQSAAGYGVRTAAVSAAVMAPPAPPATPAYVAAAQVAATTAQLFWDPVAAATGYEVEIRQSWYAADHAQARVQLPQTGTFTLQTGDTTTATVTITRTDTLVELSGLPTTYAYWDLYVRATNAGGASDWAEAYVYNDSTNLYPRQPTGLRGRRTASGTATLNWDAVTGATDYRVYFDFPADDRGTAGWDWLPWRDVTVTVTGTMATVGGLPATADSWGLRVTARNANGDESVRSAAIDVSTATAPAAPTALCAAPGTDSQMQLAWTAPTDGGTQPITGYRIERSADVDPRVWTDVVADTAGTATTWNDRGLAAATIHHYRVSARNSVGVGEPSEETSGTTRPQAALLATAAYPLTARRWPAATAPASHTWSTHDAAVQLDVAGQVRGTSGWWRVLRFGASADGPYWLPATAVTVTGATAAVPEVPGTPTALTAAPGDESSMQLIWTAATAGGTATGYRIERSADVTPRVWTEAAADIGSTATTWQDNGLAAATLYHYRVAGRNAAGPGTPSASAAGMTRPQLTLLATAAYPLKAHAWPLATAPATHTWAAYDAAVRLDVVAQGAGGGGWYRVLRFGADTDGPFWLPAGAVSVTGATTALPQAPGVPGDFQTPATTHDTVTLTWTAPTTGGTVTGYRLWRQTGEEAFTVLGTDLAANVLTYTDTTVAAATAYQYRVQALAAAGAGVRNPAVGVTTAEAPRVPGVPTALAAAPGDDSRMQLTWTAPTDAGTHPISGYRVERSADVWPRVWTDAAADTGSTDAAWSDSGLAAATTYHYRVSARNRAGAGQPSGETSGTTRPQAVLLATATYPLKAHRWPAATAPVSHTWSAHAAALRLDVAGQGPGGGGWYRVLRFGESASGPYWLPAGAVTVTGATTDVPQAPGIPGELQATETQSRVVLTWNAPVTGGTVTGYRLWRQTGEATWAVLTDSLDANAWTYTDTAVATGTTYQYRLQAEAAAGYGARTAALAVTVTPPPPPDPTYFGAAQIAAATVDLAWDAVPRATGYDLEISQSHGDPYVRVPQSGTFNLKTDATTSVTVTVVRTDTTAQLTGLPTGYGSWGLYLRATNAGGHSNWASASVTNSPGELAPAPPTGLTGTRSAAGTASLSWSAVTGATAYRVYFLFPDDAQGAAGWDWLPHRGLTVTVTGTTATVGSLPTGATGWGLRVSAFNGNAESLASTAVTVANSTS